MFRARRERLLRKLGKGVAVFIAPPPTESDKYRTSGDLLYLTGLNQPHVAWVGVAGPRPEDHLFLMPHNKTEALWDGPRADREDGPAAFGVREVHAWDALEGNLAEWLKSVPAVWMSWGAEEQADTTLVRAWKKRRGMRGGPYGLPDLRDPGPALHGLRLVKSPEEVRWLREASRVTAAGFERAVRAIRPGASEGAVEGALYEGFKAEGRDATAGWLIVGSGPNACVLHYRQNQRIMREGEAVLLDAGATAGGYFSDVSRTYPVSGRFNADQARVYDLVLASQMAAIRLCRPGVPFARVHRAAVRVLTRGLMRLGVLRQGSVTQAMKKGLYRPYYPHGTSHWIGVDGHDVGPYGDGRGHSVTLAAGHALTVEPGLYFPPGDKKVPKALRGLGVRIEDVVLVTRRGPDVLTASIPKLRRDLEQG